MNFKKLFLLILMVFVLWSGEIKPTLARILQNAPSDASIPVLVHLKEKFDLSKFANEAKAEKVMYLKRFTENSQVEIPLHAQDEKVISRVKGIKTDIQIASKNKIASFQKFYVREDFKKSSYRLMLLNIQEKSYKFNRSISARQIYASNFGPHSFLRNNRVSQDTNSQAITGVGIYILEFIGATISPFLITGYIFLDTGISESGEPHQFPRYASIYTLGNMIFSPSITYLVGKLFRQNGSYVNSALGTLIGAVVGCVVLNNYLNKPGYLMGGSDFFLMVILPPIGSVIGYNLK